MQPRVGVPIHKGAETFVLLSKEQVPHTLKRGQNRRSYPFNSEG